MEPGEFYGHDPEKQLNRSLKMEERLRHTQEQVRQLNTRSNAAVRSAEKIACEMLEYANCHPC